MKGRRAQRTPFFMRVVPKKYVFPQSTPNPKLRNAVASVLVAKNKKRKADKIMKTEMLESKVLEHAVQSVVEKRKRLKKQVHNCREKLLALHQERYNLMAVMIRIAEGAGDEEILSEYITKKTQ